VRAIRAGEAVQNIFPNCKPLRGKGLRADLKSISLHIAHNVQYSK
jgi:hypothetical protein